MIRLGPLRHESWTGLPQPLRQHKNNILNRCEWQQDQPRDLDSGVLDQELMPKPGFLSGAGHPVRQTHFRRGTQAQTDLRYLQPIEEYGHFD